MQILDQQYFINYYEGQTQTEDLTIQTKCSEVHTKKSQVQYFLKSSDYFEMEFFLEAKLSFCFNPKYSRTVDQYQKVLMIKIKLFGTIPFFIFFLNKNKQQERKEEATKSSDGKSKDSGVSQANIQAFLAKKEMEKKQKAGRRN